MNAKTDRKKLKFKYLDSGNEERCTIFPVHAMKLHRGNRVFKSKVVGDESSTSRLDHFNSEEKDSSVSLTLVLLTWKIR
jgi:hypothetical protein